WDVETGKELANREGHTAVVSSVAWSPDGKRIASAGGDRSVRLYNTQDYAEEKVFRDHAAAVSCVAFSEGSDQLVSGGGDMRVLLYNLTLGGPPIAFLGHKNVVSSVAISPDGRMLASAGGDQVIKLWDPNSRQELHSFRGHRNWISSISFSRDGHFLLSSSVDRTVRVFELGVQGSASGIGHTKEVRAVAISPDGKIVASGSADQTVRLWDRATGRELFTLSGHQTPLTALAFLPDGKTLISAAEDKGIKLWDPATGKEKASVKEQGQTSEVVILGSTPDSKQFLAWVALTDKDPGKSIHVIETYEVESGKLVRSLNVQEKVAEVTCLALSEDGGWCVVGDKKGKVTLMEVATGKILGNPLSVSERSVADLCLTPDRKRLLTADDRGELRLWNLEDRDKAIGTMAGHKQPVMAMAVSRDGRKFATSGVDNVVKVWDARQGKELRSWDMKTPVQPFQPFVRGMCFSPDGRDLVTANSDSTIYLLTCPDADPPSP
ncbi:MAG: WD40 repeat domain-containing protein, partial [Gemmataceae bacterium]